MDATLEMNGSSAAADLTPAAATEPADAAQIAVEPEKSYDDLFPSLPGAKPGANNLGGKSNENGSAWLNRKPKISSTIITQVFRIPVEERRSEDNKFGSDDNYKMLKAAMDRTGAKIEMSAAKDKSLTFLITGKQDVVLKARRELLRQFQTEATQTISIPKEHHRFILGKGGARLQELEAKTATKISVPKASEASDKITVTGPKEGIDKALHEIRNTSDEQSKQAYEVLQIPRAYLPFISGPGGETAKKLVEGRGSVRINIPPMSANKDELSIVGEKDGVLAVKAQIQKMHKDMERKFSEVSVEVKKSQHKYIIGPRGNAINEILSETGVFVEVPSADSASETITLRGQQEKLGMALTKVYEKANSVVSYDVHCPVWLHKYIIGKKGASIQKLTNDLPKVHVEFLDDGDRIKVEGPPDEVEKAREALETQANDLIAKMATLEINVDAKYHKHIIGKGGSTVNKIKQETDVTINIPAPEQGTAIIKIEGNKDGVKKAKMELESLVKKMENEREKDLIIENRFHRQLIGPKGESIQKLRDDFSAVQISFPDVNSKSDIVKLRGPKDDVEKCSKVLNKTIRELMESSYQVKVPIFKQFHKYVIGKGGATIRKIRAETETKIDLPESGSDSDMITVTGRKANVEKARDKIQQIQAEMADVVTAEVQIPSKIHNTMIGSGGKLIQSVMDDCGGVSIKFPPQENNSDKVTIRGPKDDVEKAKKMLTSMANEKQLSSMSAEVRAKPEHHKFLIGRNGVNVQKIRDQTGARIIFPGENDKDRELITILGTKEAVAAAKTELENRVKGLDNVVEETMIVAPKHHRHFVARRGEVLRQIGVEFGGVIVSFPRSGVSSDVVTLKGAKNCVDEAKARIAEIVDDLECQVTLEIEIEQVHHRTILGTRGSKVQKVSADFDVHIKIPDKDKNKNNGGEENANDDNNNNNVIRISGKKEKCEAAAKALKALVPITRPVEVAFEFHRFIIGQKGAGVRQIMDTYDVQVKVPPPEQQCSTILVSGTPSAVEEAELALKDRVADLEKEKADKALKSFEVSVEVDPEFHPKIIGRRGKVITDLRKDFDVNVQLPAKGAPDQATITITGYEANAIKAKEAILKIVHDIQALSKEEVRIDHRVHSMIIGRRGQGIRKIMTDFEVDIKLPRDGDPDPDLVVVMGQEEAVLDCIDKLKNIEEEFLQDIQDREWMEDYMKPKTKQFADDQGNRNSKGFQVAKGAPWQGASDDAFPTLGGKGGPAPTGAPTSTPAWGPSRR